MLICKGRSVRFKLVDGREFSAPAMLHDPTGRTWPKCSMLCVSFKRGTRNATDKEREGAPKEYLGRKHRILVGSVEIPPKETFDWERLGEVKELWYTRGGTKAPGRYHHAMNTPRGVYHVMFVVKGRGRAVLLRRHRAYRLELGRGCIADDRGIVFP